MENYLYMGNNCKIVKKYIPQLLERIADLTNLINNNDQIDPNLYTLRNHFIINLKRQINKINTCQDLSIQEINDLYQRSQFNVLCLDRGFKQHDGECWNDSLMMFFCYQDGIKETVQRKLYFLEPEEIMELAYSKKEINFPKMFDDEKYKTKFMNDINEYLRMMKIKFKSYYNNYMFPMSKDISVAAAIKALEIVKGCPINRSDHGANTHEYNLFIIILSYFLLDNDIETNIILKKDIKDSDINDYLGFIVGWRGGMGSHATTIYTCNGNLYHYDDNNYNRRDASSYATPIRIKNITQRTNNDLYIGTQYESTCKYLSGIKLYNISNRTSRMNLFLKYEIERNIFDNIQYYKSNGADDSVFVEFISNAIFIGNKDKNIIKKILDIGIDLNFKDKFGNSFIVNAILANSIEIFTLLLEKGVDPNSLDNTGITLINLAIYHEKIDIVRLLLDRGVNPDQIDKVGYSLLSTAVTLSHVEIIKLLLSKGANKNITLPDSTPLLEHAKNIGNSEIIDLLS
jgi:hypothetical protein